MMAKLLESRAPSILLPRYTQRVASPHGPGRLLEASHHTHTSASRKEEGAEETSPPLPPPSRAT